MPHCIDRGANPAQHHHRFPTARPALAFARAASAAASYALDAEGSCLADVAVLRRRRDSGWEGRSSAPCQRQALAAADALRTKTFNGIP